MPRLIAALVLLSASMAAAGEHRLSIDADRILLDGRPIKIIGLRCSNALISDQTTQDLIDNLDTFKAFGVNTVSVFLMGSRFGDVKGYRPDSLLNPACADRLGKIIEAADRRGMIVLVGCLYWSTSRASEDLRHWQQADANRAIANTVRWLKEHDYRNVFVDVDNEGMAHDATGWSIAAMIEAAHAVDPSILIAYNDSDPPPANADLLIHHSPKAKGKPWVQSEGTPNNAPGGYWGKYSKVDGLYNYINIGVYTDAMKQDQIRQTDADIARYNGHMCASTWLQCVAPHGPNPRPGGQGTKDDPGIRWWLEHVKARYGPWQVPPVPSPAEPPPKPVARTPEPAPERVDRAFAALAAGEASRRPSSNGSTEPVPTWLRTCPPIARISTRRPSWSAPAADRAFKGKLAQVRREVNEAVAA